MQSSHSCFKLYITIQFFKLFCHLILTYELNTGCKLYEYYLFVVVKITRKKRSLSFSEIHIDTDGRVHHLTTYIMHITAGYHRTLPNETMVTSYYS